MFEDRRCGAPADRQVAPGQTRIGHAAGRENFLRPAHPKRLLARLRRLFARARLEKEEVNILRGILARIEERVQSGWRK